jgi:CHAT domain-containing protein/Tfp pilus assembly protein PilF
MHRAHRNGFLAAALLAAFGSPAASQDARQLLAQGKHAEAERAARETLAKAEAENGAESLKAAEALDLLVLCLYQAGKAADGRPAAERAVRIKETLLGPTNPALAPSLSNLASVLLQAGNLEGAVPLYRRSLEIREKSLGPESPRLAAGLSNLGNILRELGEQAEAKAVLEKAIRLYESSREPDDLDLSAARNNLALVLQAMGDRARARELLERSLATREKALPPGHREITTSLLNLGLLLKEMDETAASEACFRRVIPILEKAGPMGERDLGSGLNHLGWVRHKIGDRPGARALYERALEIRERLLGPEHPSVAWTLNNLGLLLLESGDAAGAGPLLGRALAIRERSLGPAHPECAESLTALARVHLASGDAPLALDEALRAEGIRAAYIRLTARALAERQALGLRKGVERVEGLDLALSAAAATGGSASAARAWDALIRSRALVLDEMAARRKWAEAATADPEAARLAGEVARARERLASLYVRGPGDEPADRHRAALDIAARRKEEAEEALAARSAAFRSEKDQRVAGFAEVAAAKPERAALVAFARYVHRERSLEAPGAAGQEGEAILSYLAFVLEPGSKEPALVPLGPAARVDAAIERWRSLVRSLAPEDACRKAGDDLRRMLWDPIATRISSAALALIVPDGDIHLLPIGGLPGDGSSYLAESGPALHHVSTERDIVTLRDVPRRGKGLLAVGNPEFDAAPREPATASPVEIAAVGPLRGAAKGRWDLRGSRFEPLEASAEEAEKVAKVWRESAGATGDAAALLLGPDATEEALKRLAPGKRIVHLATHGFFLGEGAEVRARTRGIGGISSAAAADEALPVVLENPLLLSGLALAGYNRRSAAPPEADDGVLVAEEVAGLDLSGVEWAVLSACDTGRGALEAGEGVLGLSRAFQVAGARTLVMSLWSVEDRSAGEWMAALYEARLARGLSTADATRAASIAVLARRREAKLPTHPFFWAGFVAAGDWR